MVRTTIKTMFARTKLFIKENLVKRPIRAMMPIFGRKAGSLFEKDPKRFTMRNVLIFQTGGIGDVLLIFPMIEALHKAVPTAIISTLTECDTRIFSLMRERKIIHENIRFDSRRGFFEKLLFILSLRRREFDLVISPSRGGGMVECSIITLLIGKRLRVGFMKDGVGVLYTNRADFLDDTPIAAQNLGLLYAVGISPEQNAKSEVSIRIPDDALAYVRGVLNSFNDRRRKVVAISPEHASHPEMFEWPMARYLELALRLIRENEMSVVLLGKNKNLMSPANLVIAPQEEHYFLNLSGRTDLIQACAIISCCDLFIGNDSGLLHVADALGVPSIGIFGPTSPAQLFSPKSSTIALRSAVCPPCYLHQPDFDYNCQRDNLCFKSVTTDEVLEAVGAAL